MNTVKSMIRPSIKLDLAPVLKFAITVLVSCLAQSVLAQQSPIKLACVGTLTGPFAPSLEQGIVGMELYFNQVNKEGGVAGRMVSFSKHESAMDGSLVKDAVSSLVSDPDVLAFIGCAGTPQLAQLLPIASQAQVPVFAPVTGASEFKQRVSPVLFFVRAGYYAESKKLISQALTTNRSGKIGVIYQNDTFGLSLLGDLQRASLEQNKQLEWAIPFNSSAPDFKAIEDELAIKTADVIILATAGRLFVEVTKRVRKSSSKSVVMGYSLVSPDLIAKDLGSVARGVVLSQVVPSILNRPLAIVSEYRTLLKRSSPDQQPTIIGLSGFINAKLMVEALRKTPKPITRARLLKALSSIRMDVGGYSVNYTNASHDGTQFVDIAIVDEEGRLRY